MNCAIIAAGGKGTRFGGVVCKQLMQLGGRTLLARAIEPFEREKQIAEIIVVYPAEEEEAAYLETLEPEGFRKVRFVKGGATRFDSVRNGFLAIERAGIILIHDAARPLVTTALVAKVLSAAAEKGAAVPVVPIAETVKRVEHENVVETLPRESLFIAQTPQAFRYEILKKAYDEIASSYAAPSWTDESMLVEEMGFEIVGVPGEITNMKITTAKDLQLAAYYLEHD